MIGIDEGRPASVAATLTMIAVAVAISRGLRIARDRWYRKRVAPPEAAQHPAATNFGTAYVVLAMLVIGWLNGEFGWTYGGFLLFYASCLTFLGLALLGGAIWLRRSAPQDWERFILRGEAVGKVRPAIWWACAFALLAILVLTLLVSPVTSPH